MELGAGRPSLGPSVAMTKPAAEINNTDIVSPVDSNSTEATVKKLESTQTMTEAETVTESIAYVLVYLRGESPGNDADDSLCAAGEMTPTASWTGRSRSYGCC